MCKGHEKRKSQPKGPENGSICLKSEQLSRTEQSSYYRNRQKQLKISVRLWCAGLEGVNQRFLSSVLAGSTQRNALGAVDGPGGIARFQSPSKLDIDASGNLYLVDYRAIRRVSPEGVVSTAVGILGSATVFPTELPLGNLPQAIIFSNSIAVSPDGTVYLNSRLPLPGYGGCEVILKAEPL